MNIEIMKNGDNVIVIDENYNKQKREYSDNIDEILVI